MGEGRKESAKWEKADDIQVLKLWELEGAKVFPQVSILRVSNERYRKFFENPKGFGEFVNQHKIFSKDVITAGPWMTLSSVEQQADPPGWVLTALHGHMSTAVVSALPLLRMKN